MKILEKERAREMRKVGCSLGEISKEIKVSKSTASLWTKDVILDEVGMKRIRERSDLARLKSNMTAHEKKLKRLEIAEMEAGNLLNQIVLSKDTSLIALCTMYWCEGAKKNTIVSFTNSDPNLLRSFINMLIEVFNIDRGKIKVLLQLHDYHVHKELLDFWSKTLGISLSQFTKIYEKPSKHKYSAKGYMGCVRIEYYNAHIARVMLSFAKNFIKLYI